MLKSIINILTIILITILIVLGVLAIFISTKLNHQTITDSKFNKTNAPLYRFMVIVDGTDLSYVEKIEKGMDLSAVDNSVAFEFWEFKGESKEEDILRQFDIGIESKVDGIIVQAFQDERFDEILKKANDKQIPVVLLATDIPAQEKVCFFAYNRYQIGTRIGGLLNHQLNEKDIENGTIIVLGNDQAYHYEQILALHEQIEEKYNIKVEKIDYKGENILNVEGLTRKLIVGYKDLVGIICSSEEQTLGAIQALKDINKMDDVIVFGYNDSEEILEYIDRGVIYATLVSDNEKLGYDAIGNMVKYKNEEFVSMFNGITTNIITKKNLDGYMIEQGDNNE